MKNKKTYFAMLIMGSVFFSAHAQTNTTHSNEYTWTFTYLKSIHADKTKLKKFIERNWLAMDSLAVAQGLISQYELIENQDANPTAEWDLIVAVAYFTPATYADIAATFEVIRKNHTVVKVDGLTLKDLGKIVRSETVRRKQFHQKQ